MSKLKGEQLKYSVVGTVLTVSLPDESDSFSYDARKLPQAVVDKLMVHTVKKLLQERTSDAESSQARFDGMIDVIEGFAHGRFKAEPKTRQKLPEWLKGKASEVQAVAQIKGWEISTAYAKLEAAGEEYATKVFGSSAVKAKLAEFAEADDDMSDLLDE